MPLLDAAACLAYRLTASKGEKPAMEQVTVH